MEMMKTHRHIAIIPTSYILDKGKSDRNIDIDELNVSQQNLHNGYCFINHIHHEEPDLYWYNINCWHVRVHNHNLGELYVKFVDDPTNAIKYVALYCDQAELTFGE